MSSRHGLLPLSRYMPGRNRKCTHPLSQGSTKVSKTIHLGAGTAIMAGISFSKQQNNPQDQQGSWQQPEGVPCSTEGPTCHKYPITRDSETGCYTLWLGLDIIPGASDFNTATIMKKDPEKNPGDLGRGVTFIIQVLIIQVKRA